MKQILSIPSFNETLLEYTNAEDLRRSYQKYGCAGLEIIRCGEESRGIIEPDMIVGVHLIFYPVWLDFWKGNKDGLKAEFGYAGVWEGFYKGKEHTVLLEQFESDLQYAKAVGAKYVVFHVSDVTIRGVFTHEHTHTDEEVVDGAAEIINLILDGNDYEFDFLMENLWWPGLTMTRPEITSRLLEKVNYKKKGLMLDLGHLMCSNMELKTEEEAIAYIHCVLDEHESFSIQDREGRSKLTDYIKGVHMHQSVSGVYAKGQLEEVKKNGLHLKEDYYEKFSQVYQLLGKIDTHRPFQEIAVKDLIQRIQPKYLVHELSAQDRKERENVLARQSALLKE